MTVNTLRAKFRRLAATIRFFACSSSIWRWAAEMKRSTGALASICFCNSPEEPKLYRTIRPGRAAANPRPSSSTASFMLMATEKITSWATAGATPASSTRSVTIRCRIERMSASRSNRGTAIPSATSHGPGKRSDSTRSVQRVRADIFRAAVKTKTWLELDGHFVIGDGGATLLLAILERGSLLAAARQIRWSYRHAWGYLRHAEAVLGTPLTVSRPGRGVARGTLLTEQGRILLERLLMIRNTLDDTLGPTGRPRLRSQPAVDHGDDRQGRARVKLAATPGREDPLHGDDTVQRHEGRHVVPGLPTDPMVLAPNATLPGPTSRSSGRDHRPWHLPRRDLPEHRSRPCGCSPLPGGVRGIWLTASVTASSPPASPRLRVVSPGPVPGPITTRPRRSGRASSMYRCRRTSSRAGQRAR